MKSPIIVGNPRELYGTDVVTADKLDDRDFAESARVRRFPNKTGTIVGHSDSHGLFFYVEHYDGEPPSCYDPDELFLECAP